MNRERTPFLKPHIEELPNLKFFLTSGMILFPIGVATGQTNGVVVCGT
jgi:hypothetical protein